MNPLGGAHVTHADWDGGSDLSCIGNETVRAEGVLMIVGNLGFEHSNLLLELLICVSESISFKAMDGIPMLDGSNEPLCNILSMFSRDVLGEYVDSELGQEGWRDS